VKLEGMRYSADRPTGEEIVAVMCAAGKTIHGERVRGLIAVLWRAGLRISEALALAEADLDPRRGAVLVRRGTGGRRREVGSRLGSSSPSAPVLCHHRPYARSALVDRGLGITSVYLQDIDDAEIIETVRARPAPMVPGHVTLSR
jgi:hypothetical protein